MNRFLIAVFAATSLWPSGGQSSPPPGDSLSFTADIVSFPDKNGDAETKIFVSLPPGTDPTHSLYVSIKIKTAKGVPQKKRTLIVDAAGLTRAENEGWFLPRFDFRLPPGEFSVVIAIEDLETEARKDMKLKFRIPDQIDRSLAISDLLFGVCHEMSITEFGRRAWETLTPRPSRSYGDGLPDMCVAVEVASSSPTPPGGRYSIRGSRGETVQSWTDITVPMMDGKGSILLQPDISGLGHGTYELWVEIRWEEGRVLRKGWFKIDGSRIAFKRDREKWQLVMGYIATNRELINFHSVSDDSLEAFWNRFWEIRNPNPETGMNMARDEFVRRVEESGRRFGSLKPGWETDRGRVYIQFGEPDRIEEVMGHGARPSSRTWIYEARQKTFRFEDRDGLGGFILVGSGRP